MPSLDVIARAAAGVLSAVVLAASLTACEDPREGAAEAAERLAQALAAGNVATVEFAEDGGSSAAEEFPAIIEGLAPLKPAVRSELLDGDSPDTAAARLHYTWDVDRTAEDWTYSTTAELRRVDGDWKPVWSPAVVHDGLAPKENLRLRTTPAPRGDILGPDGGALVTARPVVRVGIDKTRVKAAALAASAERLARLVGIDANAYGRQVSAAAPQAFVEAIVLRNDAQRTVTDQQIQAIPGALGLADELPLASSREFARPILGSVGPVTAELVEQSKGRLKAGDMAGLAGLQLAHDEQLSGTPGVAIEVVSGSAEPRRLFAKEPIAGESLKISMDARLQSLAERTLADESLADQSTPTAIVAIRPSTGDVLAAASGPGSEGYSTATLGQYAPGSTFKIAAALALLRQGRTPESRVSCPAQISVDGRIFKNFGGYPAASTGDIALREAIAQSCNTAFIGSRETVSQQQLAEAARSLGIGVEMDLGVDAFAGSVPETAEGTEHAASMIGQGRVLVSPLALATMAASVAAGKRVAPRLVLDGAAGTSTGTQPSIAEPDLTRPEAAQLQELMRAVVTDGHLGTLRDLPGSPVIAKTGTAEFGNDVPPKTHAWVVAAQGDLAVAVFVEDGDLGSVSGGPLMRAFLADAARSAT